MNHLLERVWKFARSGDRAYSSFDFRPSLVGRVPSRGVASDFPNTLWVAVGLVLWLSPLPVPAQATTGAEAVETDRRPPGDDFRFERRIVYRGREKVFVGKDVVLAKGEASRGIVVISGSATIEGTVDGDLVVIGGRALVKGEVRGNIVAVLGSAQLESGAVAERDVIVIGGRLTSVSDAQIHGDNIEIPFGISARSLTYLQQWINLGLFRARPLPHQLTWVWNLTAIVMLLYLALSLIFHRPLQACVKVCEVRPFGALLTGLLAFLLLAPLLLLLAVSVVGIVVIPFALCGLFAAFVFGKMAVYQYAGQQLGRQTGLGILEQPLIGLILGLVIFCLLYTIPIVGFVVWGLLAPLGLGIGVLAFLGGIRKERPNTPPRPLNSAAPAAPPPPSTPPPPPSFAPGPAASLAAAAAPPPESISPLGTIPSVEPNPPLTSPPPPTTPISDWLLLPRAGFWVRFWASVMDFLLLGAFIVFAHWEHTFLLWWLAYHIGMWTWKGTTIGGIVVGLKIVRIDGSPFNYAVAIVRALSCVLSAIPVFAGFFWAGWDKECQSWHDRIAGTVIVRVPKSTPLI